MSDYKYLIKRHDGKEISIWDTRHAAVGWKALYHDCNEHGIIPISVLGAWHIEPSQPDHENRVANRRV